MRLPGIATVVFLKTNIQSKIMHATTMIPCRRVSEGVEDWAQTPLLTCPGVDDFFPRRKASDRQNGRPRIGALEWKLRLEFPGDQEAALTSSSLGYYAVSVSDSVVCSGMVGLTAIKRHLHPQVGGVEVS